MDGQDALESLITLLDGVPASEFVLVVEPALIPLLSALAPYSTFTSHGVTALVPLSGSLGDALRDTNTTVFLTRPNPESILLISECARSKESTFVIVTPEIELSVPLLFTKFGVLGDIQLLSWPVGFIPDPIDRHLLQLFDTKSPTDASKAVWPLVWSLDWLQKTCTGSFGRVTSIGPQSRYLASLLKKKRAESLVKEQTEPSSATYFDYRFGYASSKFFANSIEQAIIMDRDMDLVTPLLCQTTYGGVVAETIGITASGVTKTGMKTSLKDDTLFESLFGDEFSTACEYLHVSAKQLQQEYRSGNDLSQESDPSLAEIRETVKRLGSLQKTQKLLDVHAELASIAIHELESGTRREAYELQMQLLDNQLTNTQAIAKLQDLIYRGADLALVLRLLSLLCLVRGGIKENVLHALFHGDILKTYGYQVLNTYHYLYKRGLVYPSKSSSFLLSSSSFPSFARFGGELTEENSVEKSPSAMLETPASHIYSWYTLNKSYKLYPSDEAEAKPYSGFVPLAARLVKLDHDARAKSLLESEISDETFAPRDEQSLKEAKLRRTLIRNSAAAAKTKPAVLVVIVGGVTYAEVTAIKRAFRNEERDIIIASDCVINGNDIVLNQ